MLTFYKNRVTVMVTLNFFNTEKQLVDGFYFGLHCEIKDHGEYSAYRAGRKCTEPNAAQLEHRREGEQCRDRKYKRAEKRR